MSSNTKYQPIQNPSSSHSSSNHNAPFRDYSDSRSSSETSVDELDPLQDPLQFAPQFSSSDDDEYYGDAASGGEKVKLRRTKTSPRNRHKRVASAYQIPWSPVQALFSAVPEWLVTRRSVIAGLLLALFGMVMVAFTRGFWRYRMSTVDGASPPWYPTPAGGTAARWEQSYKKAADLVGRMTLVEKVNITTGTGWEMGMCVGNTGPVHRLGFPSLCLQDGPLGIRFADNITANPAGITVGATWNKELMYKRGRSIGAESRMKGVNVILGPSVGPLGRIPAGGRNWEAFGIDPVLQGEAAARTIDGIQEEGVMATIKHFVANEQEHFRQAWEWGLPVAISSNLDDRSLHELYAWPFADAIRAGAASVMCSYNQVNNSHACQNSKLINGILKDELGFQGFVQSDWLAQRSGVASVLSGLDMSMPGDGERWADGKPFWGPYLTMAALNGSIPMERLNDMATRVVAAWYQLHQDEWPTNPRNGDGGPNFSSWTDEEYGLLHPGSDDETKDKVNYYVDAGSSGGFSHAALARRIAAEGTVLLKNHGSVLPLSRKGMSQTDESREARKERNGKYKIAIFGEDAVTPDGGANKCPDRACNEGTLAQGWGSGSVEFPYLVSPADALQKAFYKDSVEVSVYPTNEYPNTDSNSVQNQDFCIVFANAAGGEGFASYEDIKGDRNDLNLQKGGDELIESVSSNCGRRQGGTHGRTIVVIHAIGPVLLESFIENPDVSSVLFANLPGQESGNAIADVILGQVNPSGHLPYTIAKSAEDYGPSAEIISEPNAPVPQQNFTEGLLVDYRWFDAMKIVPRFEFGYGLSYTEFRLENLQIRTADSLRGERPAPLPAPRPKDETKPPSYDNSVPPADEALFPRGWRKLKKYIYPYLESVDDVTNDPSPTYEIFPNEEPSPAGGGEGGNPSLWEELIQIEVDIVNEGERGGMPVVQLYLAFPADVYEDAADDLAESAWPPPETAAPREPAPPAPPLQPRKRQENSMFDGTVLSRERVTFPPRVLRGFEKIHLRGSISVSSPGGSIPNPHVPLEMYQDAPPQQVAGHARHAPARRDNTAHGRLHRDVQQPAKTRRQEIAPLKMDAAKLDQQGKLLKVNHAFTQQPTQYSSGQKKTVLFSLNRRDLSYWSAAKQNWVIPQRGSFGIEVGFSSRDVRERGRVF